MHSTHGWEGQKGIQAMTEELTVHAAVVVCSWRYLLLCLLCPPGLPLSLLLTEPQLQPVQSGIPPAGMNGPVKLQDDWNQASQD